MRSRSPSCAHLEELDDLREGWNNWLRDEENRRTARKYPRALRGAARSEHAFGQRGADPAHRWEGIPAYKGVTAPNVASTVLLVREDAKTLLLTGDNHPDMIRARV